MLTTASPVTASSSSGAQEPTSRPSVTGGTTKTPSPSSALSSQPSISTTPAPSLPSPLASESSSSQSAQGPESSDVDSQTGSSAHNESQPGQYDGSVRGSQLGESSTETPIITTSSSSSVVTPWAFWLLLGAAAQITGIVAFVFMRRRARHSDGTDKATVVSSCSTAKEPLTGFLESSQGVDALQRLESLDTWRVGASTLQDVALIGNGGQCAVFLVKMNDSELLVSKRLVPDQFSPSKLDQLIDEIKPTATLHHPSIVAFIGASWTSPYDLQALYEYMPNGDLRSYLDKTKPTSWDATKLNIALSVAQALVYVHSFNPPIVHRDVKARNVMLNDDLRAKLTDFGVAREQSEEGTMTTGIGTNRWLAPEVIRGGGKYNEQCDIYSFGVLLTELDTHRVPYADVVGVSEIVLLHQVSKGELRPTLSPTCDPAVRDLINRCLEQNAALRLSAMEIAFRLRQMIKELT